LANKTADGVLHFQLSNENVYITRRENKGRRKALEKVYS